MFWGFSFYSSSIFSRFQVGIQSRRFDSYIKSNKIKSRFCGLEAPNLAAAKHLTPMRLKPQPLTKETKKQIYNLKAPRTLQNRKPSSLWVYELNPTKENPQHRELEPRESYNRKKPSNSMGFKPQIIHKKNPSHLWVLKQNLAKEETLKSVSYRPENIANEKPSTSMSFKPQNLATITHEIHKIETQQCHKRNSSTSS